MFIKYEAEVSSRVGGGERGVVDFGKLLRPMSRNSDYEMVHSEVYLNKYLASIAPFSTSARPDCSQNIT